MEKKQCIDCRWLNRFKPRPDEIEKGLVIGCRHPGYEGYTWNDAPACGGTCFEKRKTIDMPAISREEKEGGRMKIQFGCPTMTMGDDVYRLMFRTRFVSVESSKEEAFMTALENFMTDGTKMPPGTSMDHKMDVLAVNESDAQSVADGWLSENWPGRTIAIFSIIPIRVHWKETRYEVPSEKVG